MRLSPAILYLYLYGSAVNALPRAHDLQATQKPKVSLTSLDHTLSSERHSSSASFSHKTIASDHTTSTHTTVHQTSLSKHTVSDQTTAPWTQSVSKTHTISNPTQSNQTTTSGTQPASGTQTGSNTLSTGSNTQSTGSNTQSTGSNTQSTGSNTQSTGSNTQSTGSNTQSTGSNTQFTGSNTQSTGSSTQATGSNHVGSQGTTSSAAQTTHSPPSQSGISTAAPTTSVSSVVVPIVLPGTNTPTQTVTKTQISIATPSTSGTSGPLVIVQNPKNPDEKVKFGKTKLPESQRGGLPVIRDSSPLALLLLLGGAETLVTVDAAFDVVFPLTSAAWLTGALFPAAASIGEPDSKPSGTQKSEKPSSTASKTSTTSCGVTTVTDFYVSCATSGAVTQTCSTYSSVITSGCTSSVSAITSTTYAACPAFIGTKIVWPPKKTAKPTTKPTSSKHTPSSASQTPISPATASKTESGISTNTKKSTSSHVPSTSKLSTSKHSTSEYRTKQESTSSTVSSTTKHSTSKHITSSPVPTSVHSTTKPPPPPPSSTSSSNVIHAQTVTSNGMVCVLIEGSNDPQCTPLSTPTPNAAGTNVNIYNGAGCGLINNSPRCAKDAGSISSVYQSFYNVASQPGEEYGTVLILLGFDKNDNNHMHSTATCQLQARWPSNYGDVYVYPDGCLYDSSSNKIFDQCCSTPDVNNSGPATNPYAPPPPANTPSQSSGNHDGSSICRSISKSTCLLAAARYVDDVVYGQYTSAVWPDSSGADIVNAIFPIAGPLGEYLFDINYGCTVIWECDNADAYSKGMTGRQIKQSMLNIYNLNGAKGCGSTYLDNSCHITVNGCNNCRDEGRQGTIWNPYAVANGSYEDANDGFSTS